MLSARFDKKVVRLRMQLVIITCVFSFVQVHADLLVSHSYGTCTKKVLQKTSSDVVLRAVDVSPASRVNICAVELASPESVVTIGTQSCGCLTSFAN